MTEYIENIEVPDLSCGLRDVLVWQEAHPGLGLVIDGDRRCFRAVRLAEDRA